MKGLRRHLKMLKRPFGNQRGIALLLATFSLALMLYLAMEVQYETQVEYVVNQAAINELKAYYAARSGVELSLLRIKIYQAAKAQVQAMGPQAAQFSPLLNLIWSFPFLWPPELPGEVNEVDRDLIQNAVKEATLDSSYYTTISDEGTKLDINDLDSPSKALRESTKRLMLQIFENEQTNDTAFAKNNRDFRPEELVGNLIDWMDGDKTRTDGGGDESSVYEDTGTGISYPPNRQFRTIDEIRLVAGMNEELFNLLKDRITIYGAKAINPNTAPAEVIQSIDPTITAEIASSVITRRQDFQQGGPFRSAEEFWQFISGKGARITEEVQKNTPILVDATFNFRIKSVGSYGKSTREIEAIVFDIPNSARAIAEYLKKEAPTPPPGSTPTPTPTPTPQTTAQGQQSATKGPPRIVYWFER